MKNVLKEIGVALILGVLLPGIILNGVIKLSHHRMDLVHETEVVFYTQPEGDTIQIRVLQTDETVAIMELEEYITGVVLAEMPASFEPEALKAQAVAADAANDHKILAQLLTQLRRYGNAIFGIKRMTVFTRKHICVPPSLFVVWA